MIREPQLKLTVTNKAVQVEVKDRYHSKRSSMSWSKLRQAAVNDSGYKAILEEARAQLATKQLTTWDYNDNYELYQNDPDLCRFKTRGAAELAMFLSGRVTPA